MFNVEPLKPEERPRCAHCGALMFPRPIHSVRDGDQFKTNRRIVQARKIGGAMMGTEWWIKYFPTDKSDWGYDGIFCKLRCAWRFARAAHRAGYRIQQKVAA